VGLNTPAEGGEGGAWAPPPLGARGGDVYPPLPAVSESPTTGVPAAWRGQPQGTPYTLHPKPYTLHPKPYTLHPTPQTLHPKPYTLNPKP